MSIIVSLLELSAWPSDRGGTEEVVEDFGFGGVRVGAGMGPSCATATRADINTTGKRRRFRISKILPAIDNP
jgi:hypothetical protein